MKPETIHWHAVEEKEPPEGAVVAFISSCIPRNLRALKKRVEKLEEKVEFILRVDLWSDRRNGK